MEIIRCTNRRNIFSIYTFVNSHLQKKKKKPIIHCLGIRPEDERSKPVQMFVDYSILKKNSNIMPSIHIM